MTLRRTIVVCGNGASAVALLHALSKNPVEPLRVVIIGNGPLGEGVAYATRNPGHLLNTPAGRMSIDPQDPDQFLHWLHQRNISVAGWAGQFVPRTLYAGYLRDMAARAMRSPALAVEILQQEIVSLTRNRARWRVAHGAGTIDADLVVLATGNDMPTPVSDQLDTRLHPLVIENPWQLPRLDPDARTLILGTGLTAVDSVLTLMDAGHRGEIVLLSRHALLPQLHVPPQPSLPLPEPYPRTASGMLRALRKAAASQPAAWQDFMDAMRGHWPLLWQALGTDGQRRFLRHGASIWNMHRHRLPPQVARRLHAALSGNARLLKGRLVTAERSGERDITATIRHGGETKILQVNRIINCMGPNIDPEKTPNRLVENIIASLQACPGPCGIGLDINAQNRVIGHDGLAHLSLFAMGSLTRGRWWEITAMPEIARQAGDIADAVAAFCLRDIAEAVDAR